MLSDRNLKLVFKMVVIAGWGGGGLVGETLEL